MRRFVIFSFISNIAKFFNAVNWVFFIDSRWLEMLGEENNLGTTYVPLVAEDSIEGVLDCSKLRAFDCALWTDNPDPILRISRSLNFLFPFQLDDDSEGIVFKVYLESKVLVGFIALTLPSSSVQPADRLIKLAENLSQVSYLLELVFQTYEGVQLPQWQDFYAKCLNYSALASGAVLILGRLLKYDDLFVGLGAVNFELWRKKFVKDLKEVLSDNFVSFYVRDVSYILIFCSKMSSAYYKKKVSAALKKSLEMFDIEFNTSFDFSWQNFDLNDELDLEEVLNRGHPPKLATG